MATRFVRAIVKRWPRHDPAATVRRARRVFGLGSPLNFLYTRGLVRSQVRQGEVRGEWLAPRGVEHNQSVLLYLHGGGYVACSPGSHLPITATLARLLKRRVFSVDYRLAPEHPFPAAVDDAAAAYSWLLTEGVLPQSITVAGDSAGGGLALSLLLRLRRTGVRLPARAVLIAPWVDLTGKGPYRNVKSCAMFTGEEAATFAALYLNGTAPETEECSPLFADLHGLPPLLIQISSTEMLLVEAERLHERAQAAGVDARLSIYPGLPHVW
ncbi:MAG TPA: alpha/beta hydrolase fold domain-containing protein, partial [Terriglobales bacterium]|nr:alpha/beta hydrolase fold domain-containing protein [Terriglobales bacterium]